MLTPAIHVPKYGRATVLSEKYVGMCFTSESKGVGTLRKPPSIAFDVASLEDARASGAKTVHIIDEESGKVYRASIPTILSNGFRFNRGRGDQIGLRFVYWQLGDDPLATQLSFGGEL